MRNEKIKRQTKQGEIFRDLSCVFAKDNKGRVLGAKIELDIAFNKKSFICRVYAEENPDSEIKEGVSILAERLGDSYSVRINPQNEKEIGISEKRNPINQIPKVKRAETSSPIPETYITPPQQDYKKPHLPEEKTPAIRKSDIGEFLKTVNQYTKTLSLEDSLAIRVSGMGQTSVDERESILHYVMRYEGHEAEGENPFETWGVRANNESYLSAAQNQLEGHLKNPQIQVTQDVDSSILEIQKRQEKNTATAGESFVQIQNLVKESPSLIAILDTTQINTGEDSIVLNFSSQFNKGRFEKKAREVMENAFPGKEIIFK